MSPLWNGLNNIHNSLSPNIRRDETKSALNKSIEGIWAFASRFTRGSMTVEAAVVLPLFLFFSLALGSVMEMIRLHGNLEFALCDIGNRMSVYGSSTIIREESGFGSELADIAFTYTYVKKEIEEYLGRGYLEASPLVKGVDGLQFRESEIWDNGEQFEVLVTYKVLPFGGMAGFKGFRMANRYYGHFWNGYEIPTNVVYVAENGEVYHIDAMCTHLYLSVRQVSLQEAYRSRNRNGERYDLCEYCEKGEVKNTVYITEEGNRFHYKSNCTGLKRTVFEVPADETDGYRACSRCARRE